jgi:hypothetical protein
MSVFSRHEAPVENPESGDLSSEIAETIGMYGYNVVKPVADSSADQAADADHAVNSDDIRVSLTPVKTKKISKEPDYIARYTPADRPEPKVRQEMASSAAPILSERLADKVFSEPVALIRELLPHAEEVQPAYQEQSLVPETSTTIIEPKRFSFQSLKKFTPLFMKTGLAVSEVRERVAAALVMPDINLRGPVDRLRQTAAETKDKTVRRAKITAAVGAVVLGGSVSRTANRQTTAEVFTLPDLNIHERVKNAFQRARETRIPYAKETAIGALLVGAAVAGGLAMKHIGVPHLNSDTAANSMPQSGPKSPSVIHESPVNSVDILKQAVIAMKVTHTHHAVTAIHKVKEYKEALSFSGDNVWNHVSAHLQAKLGHMPSNELIQKVTDKVLKDNNLSWTKAAHLPKGTLIHISEKFLR